MISVILMTLLVLPGYGAAADPNAGTSHHDPAPAQRSVRSWWRQLTDTTGFIDGQVVNPDAHPDPLLLTSGSI